MGSLLKLGFRTFWQACLFGLLAAGFVLVSGRWAILQSKTQLADFLHNAAVLQNVAVLITLESTLCFAFCFSELTMLFGKKKSRWWKAVLSVYPGLLQFPVLFYLQTQLIFAFPGTGFVLLSCLMALGVLVALLLFRFLLMKLCPEKELRLEVYFLVHLFICLMGLITTVDGNTTYPTAHEPIHVRALLLSLGLFVGLFALGFWWNKYKWIHNKHKNGNHL
jgi:hypothetical protein